MSLVIILIVCALTLITIQVEHRKAMKRLSAPYEPNELNTPQGMAPNDAEQCSVYEIRMTQQKMVDAGIIKAYEMSVCENDNCLNCHPKAALPKPAKPRTVMVRGEEVKIPDEIPDYAYPSINPMANDHFFEVVWEWTDPNTGRRMFMRSVHPKARAFESSLMPVRSQQTIDRLRGDKKELKQMLAETKRQTEAYRKARDNEYCNDCDEIVIEDGDGATVRIDVQYCRACRVKNNPHISYGKKSR